MLRIKAFAKINLILKVVRKRNDGYHEIASVMQKIDLHDDIFLEKADVISLTTDSAEIPPDRRNLAWQAAELFFADSGIMGGASIHIGKRIPVEAGMGGGSSDAAAVLEGLNILYGTGFSADRLAAMGSCLGSDVAFFLYGPICLAEGRGEAVTELKTLPQICGIGMRPPFGISAAGAYAGIGETASGTGEAVYRYTKAIDKVDIRYIINNMENDLAPGCEREYPGLAEVRREMKEAGCAVTLLSGSGPVVFSLAETCAEAEKIFRRLKKSPNEIFLIKTLEDSSYQERIDENA